MIYIDTANIDTMIEMGKFPWILGFTSNPTLLSQEGKTSFELLEEIPKNFSSKLFIQLEGESENEMLNHYRKLKTIESDLDIVIKIPMNQSGIETIRSLRRIDPQVKILATAIYSSNQGIFAGILGCDYVAPYYNRIENEGFSAHRVIADIASFYQTQGIETKIMAASFKNILQVKKAFLSGADFVTISPNLYQSFYQNKSSQADIDKFNGH